MINWDLLTFRNIFVIGLFALIAMFVFKYFSKKAE